MIIVVERIDRAISRCRATRSDGVVIEFVVHNHPRRLPHDLCHFAIESTLGLTDGFWGLLDRGAMFKGMARVAGPGKDRSARRLVERKGARVEEIEFLVAGVTGCWERGDRALEIEGLSRDELSRCLDALDALNTRWQEVSDGQELYLDWPGAGSANGTAS